MKQDNSQEMFISVKKNWRLLLQAAVAEAAGENIDEDELQKQFDEEFALYYINDGDLENPNPDNVYDMIKDKELGL